MQIKDLINQQTVRLRLGKAGEEDVNWGPWHSRHLYISKGKKPEHTIIVPTGLAWAEYTARDFDPTYKTFECEGYYMQIEGLE